MLQEKQQANLMILHTLNITKLCFWKDIEMWLKYSLYGAVAWLTSSEAAVSSVSGLTFIWNRTNLENCVRNTFQTMYPGEIMNMFSNKHRNLQFGINPILYCFTAQCVVTAACYLNIAGAICHQNILC